MGEVNTRERVATAVVATAAGIGAMLLACPDADASPLSYLQGLNNTGLEVYDAGAALATGYAVCVALETANGADVARELFLSTSWADMPNIETAAAVVVVSVEQLCPWHDHRTVLR